MAKKLALLCDVQRLVPHEEGDHPALVLGLTLQAVFTEDFVASDDAAWTELWYWQAIPSVDIWFFPANPAQPGVLAAQKPLWDLAGGAAPPAEALRVLHDRTKR